MLIGFIGIPTLGISHRSGLRGEDSSIGEVRTPGADPQWISAQVTRAIRHIVKVCGPPPPEMELEVQWQEHGLGSYPKIVLLWEDAMRGTTWNYLERCRVALTAYENGGELPPGWSMPR